MLWAAIMMRAVVSVPVTGMRVMMVALSTILSMMMVV